MTRYEIRPTIIPDIQKLSKNLRSQDREEIRKLGAKPRSALMQGYLHGECYTGLFNKQVLTVFGVVPEGTSGRVWMLCSPEINSHLLTISRESLKQIRHFSTQYKMLFNIVDEANDLTIRWLRGLGFQFGNTIPIGPEGHNFKEFYLCHSR